MLKLSYWGSVQKHTRRNMKLISKIYQTGSFNYNRTLDKLYWIDGYQGDVFITYKCKFKLTTLVSKHFIPGL